MNFRFIGCVLIAANFFAPKLTYAKLLDRIVAVADNKVITLSQVRRFRSNLQARRNISPEVIRFTKGTNSEISKYLVHSYLIRESLNEIGFNITDEQVESEIKMNEERLRISRRELEAFLTQNNMSFDEYFELIRESKEYLLFVSRQISPLISVTDQQVKNTFYNKNLNNKTFSFNYELVNYTFPKSSLKKQDAARLKQVLTRYQVSGILPEKFKNMDVTNLGSISEDGLSKEMARLLKKTNEGSFSNPIVIGDNYNVFFVKKKDLAESEIFARVKNRIRAQIFKEESRKMIALWFERESLKHFIQYL